MSNYVIMPKTDWEDILSATRQCSKSNDLLLSSEVASMIREFSLVISSVVGQFTPNYSSSITVTGLPFKPKHIIFSTDAPYSSPSTIVLMSAQFGLLSAQTTVNTNGRVIENVGAYEYSYTITITDDGFSVTSKYPNSYKLIGSTYTYLAIGEASEPYGNIFFSTKSYNKTGGYWESRNILTSVGKTWAEYCAETNGDPFYISGEYVYCGADSSYVYTSQDQSVRCKSTDVIEEHVYFTNVM